MALFSVLLLLGCVEPPVTSFEGVTAIFSSEPEVYGNGEERVEAFLIVQNTGDSLASNVYAELFNYGDLTGTFSGSLGTLEPHGQDYPGEIQDYSFILDVPELGMGMTDTIDLGVRVSYDYSTYGKADIPVIPKRDWKQKEEAGVIYSLDKLNSAGPLSIETVPSRSPILVSFDYRTFGLRFVVDNTGPGRVANDTLQSAVLTVSDGIELANPVQCDFHGTLTPTNRDLDITDEDELGLIQGKRKTLICRFNVTDIELENTYAFQLALTYRYQVDAFTPITIIGTPPQ